MQLVRATIKQFIVASFTLSLGFGRVKRINMNESILKSIPFLCTKYLSSPFFQPKALKLGGGETSLGPNGPIAA